MEQRHYETTFLFFAETEQDSLATINDYMAFLKKEKATIIDQQPPIQTNLAYPIQKRTSGTYQGIQFVASPTLIDKLETTYRRDERILRSLTIQLDKHAITYKKEQREKKNDVANKENQ